MKRLLFILVLILVLISGCSEVTVVKYADCNLASRVIDGDTFVLQDGSRVRLIGMDTPEKGEYYFEEAKMALNSMIMGKCMVLTKDVSETDIYNRLLRYVYVDGIFVNEYLVEQGYAKSYPYEPDVKYQDVFEAAQERAMEKKLGIWISLIETCSDLGCESNDLYVGSLNSDKYHNCSSGVAKRINRENIICFESEDEAINYGYSPGSSV